MNKFKDGWYHTGDVVKIDKKKFITYIGRTDDSINLNDINYSISYVEKYLLVSGVFVTAGKGDITPFIRHDNRIILNCFRTPTVGRNCRETRLSHEVCNDAEKFATIEVATFNKLNKPFCPFGCPLGANFHDHQTCRFLLWTFNIQLNKNRAGRRGGVHQAAH